MVAAALAACGPVARSGDLTTACTAALEAVDAAPGSQAQEAAAEEMRRAAAEGDNPELAQLGDELAGAIDDGDDARIESLLTDVQSRCEDQGGI